MLEAAEAFLDVLAIDARRQAVDAHVESLSSRAEQVRALVDAGRALEADLLRVELALADARHEAVTLAETRTVATRRLAATIGLDGEVEVGGTLPSLPAAEPDVDELIAQAVASRPDLSALTASATGKQRRAAAVRAEVVPRLDATARWSWTDGSPYAQSSWLEGSVRVVWTPFAAGTRGQRAAALDAEALALVDEALEARRGVALEVRQAASSLTVARDARAVAGRAVGVAAEARRVEGERYLAGRATVTDLLTAEAEVLRRTAAADVAAITVVRAWLRLGAAIGTEALLP